MSSYRKCQGGSNLPAGITLEPEGNLRCDCDLELILFFLASFRVDVVYVINPINAPAPEGDDLSSHSD